MAEELRNRINEYFTEKEGNKDFLIAKEIFKADKEDVDIKTDLTLQEINYINILLYNNDYLQTKGLQPVYSDFLKNYLRLKISLDRKSRVEFVNLNKNSDIVDNQKNLNNIKDIQQTKK